MAVCIRKRGRSYSAYWREGGKIRSKTLGRDRRMAYIKRAEMEKRLLERRSGLAIQISWEEFKEKCLTFSSANHATSTATRDGAVFKNLEQTIPVKTITELTPEKLEQYKAVRKNQEIQASTLNRELVTIKAAIKRAAEWGYAAPNLASVQKVRAIKKRPVFFTSKDLQNLLSKADPFWTMIIYLGFYAGLRRGEIIHLEWADVDFEHRLLRIKPQLGWHPKDKEAREIPIHPDLEKKLNEWREQSPDSLVVIPWDKKTTTLSCGFTRIRKRTGLTHGSLHSLRHSFASHLAMAGIDLLRIGQMMGHSSVTTTQMYAHLLPSSLREAVLKLSSINYVEEKARAICCY